MKIQSHNEWDQLRSVVVGSAKYANWPSSDPVFSKESEKTTWKETPVPSGPVPQHIIDETEEDLQGLCDILTGLGVEVHRPSDLDFVNAGGMYNYCPRDRLLVAGKTIVDPAMMYPCRDMELDCYQDIVNSADRFIQMPRGQDMTCDAANICRLGDKWLYLESSSGNRKAAEWLAEQFPHIDIYGCDFYSGVHIDSTIVPLRAGLVLLNGARVNDTNCPTVFNDWEKVFINEEDIVAQDFYQYPYASKWIALNMLSVNPSTVIVDKKQTKIINKLEKRGFTVITHELRHSRTLGGGFHCVTLDLWRE
jgi:glycine amidinotransferase/scyllo-inosamine-4-phosphate amidinotransferase 1